MTDTAGVFRFPVAEIHSKWTLLIFGPSDRRAPEYSVCINEGDRFREVYRGIQFRETVRDSLMCIADTTQSGRGGAEDQGG